MHRAACCALDVGLVHASDDFKLPRTRSRRRRHHTSSLCRTADLERLGSRPMHQNGQHEPFQSIAVRFDIDLDECRRGGRCVWNQARAAFPCITLLRSARAEKRSARPFTRFGRVSAIQVRQPSLPSRGCATELMAHHRQQVQATSAAAQSDSLLPHRH